MTTVTSLPQISPRILTMPDTLKNALVDAITDPARPAVDRPAKPALVDTFSTVEGRPGTARVLSSSVDKLTGARKSYELAWCMYGNWADRTDKLMVLGCGCQGFHAAGACRHAIKLFDCLNLPAVLRAFTWSPGLAVVKEAHEVRPCAFCKVVYGVDSTVYRVEYFPGVGNDRTVIQCPRCLSDGGAE